MEFGCGFGIVYPFQKESINFWVYAFFFLVYNFKKGFEQGVKKQSSGLFFSRGNERQRGDRHGSAETKSLSACQKESINFWVYAFFFYSIKF